MHFKYVPKEISLMLRNVVGALLQTAHSMLLSISNGHEQNFIQPNVFSFPGWLVSPLTCFASFSFSRIRLSSKSYILFFIFTFCPPLQAQQSQFLWQKISNILVSPEKTTRPPNFRSPGLCIFASAFCRGQFFLWLTKFGCQNRNFGIAEHVFKYFILLYSMYCIFCLIFCSSHLSANSHFDHMRVSYIIQYGA